MILNKKQIKSLFCYCLVLIGSCGAFGVALYMQHVKGLLPCTMCIIQRYAFGLISLSALISILLPLRSIRFLALLTGVISALGGVIAAIRNLWVLAHPDIVCGRDPVELFLNSLPLAKMVPKIFLSLGLCSDPIPPLFGLSLPVWSLIGFGSLTALLIIGWRRN